MQKHKTQNTKHKTQNTKQNTKNNTKHKTKQKTKNSEYFKLLVNFQTEYTNKTLTRIAQVGYSFKEETVKTTDFDKMCEVATLKEYSNELELILEKFRNITA